MTLIDIGETVIPTPIGASGYVTSTIDADGEKIAFIFHLPRSGTLKSIGARLNKTTTDTLTYRLETVDAATGAPTGTLYVADASGSVSVDAAGVWWFALNSSTGVSVTDGDMVAFVLTQGSVPGNHAIYVSDSGFYRAGGSFPYYTQYMSAAWSKYPGVMIALEYSDAIATPIGAVPLNTAHTTAAYKTSTNPNIRGNLVRLPFGARLSGLCGFVDADYPCELKVYGSDGATVLATVSLDPDIRGLTSASAFIVKLSSPVTLVANTWYRVALKATDNGGNIALGYVDMATIGSYDGLDLLPLGTDCIYTACNGDPDEEADWSQTDERRASISLVIDQIDIPAGGGACASIAVI